MKIQQHDIVFIRNLTMDAIIGIYDYERTTKQPISLTIEMEWDNRKAGKTDDIAFTLDYEKISNEVKDFVANSAYLLVEKLAEELANHLLTQFRIPAIMIELNKLTAIKDTDAVGVKIYRQNPLQK